MYRLQITLLFGDEDTDDNDRTYGKYIEIPFVPTEQIMFVVDKLQITSDSQIEWNHELRAFVFRGYVDEEAKAACNIEIVEDHIKQHGWELVQ
jgi:hypothetical protein